MNRLLGDVTLNEIKDSIAKFASKKEDEIMKFQEFASAIRELHVQKLGDDSTPNQIADSYAKTANELSKINYLSFGKVDQHFIESMTNLYHTIMYMIILSTLKKTNDAQLVQNAERDFKPLIKKHWERFTELTSEFV
tara:strand:+ start:4577 stop:4987 length:411 start_codon:yes stop_codon:yes gene_type:complete